MDNKRAQHFWLSLTAIMLLVLLLSLLRTGVALNPRLETAAPSPPPSLNPVRSGRQSRPVRQRVTGLPTEDRLAAALLGEGHAPLSPGARRLLARAVLCLDHLHDTVGRLYAGASPADSQVTVLTSYGQVLFVNDYNYASRAHPELDAGAADWVYTNALHALENPDLLVLAREAGDASAGSDTARRPSVRMDEHYRAGFEAGFPSETLQAYSNLLATVQGFVNYDPLSTDLFNEAVLYVMSKTEMEQMNCLILRGFSDSARWEATGVRPPRRGVLAAMELPDPNVPDPDLNPPNIDASVREDLLRPLVAYRDIFGYRFAENHGLTDERFMEALAATSVPPTALWIHISPP